MAAEPVPLVDLTDEELAALAGPPGGLVVSPYLEGLEPAQQDLAVVTAYRSLVARGVVGAPSPEQAQDAVRGARGSATVELDVTLSEPLSQALSLRRLAPTVLCAQRTGAQSSSWRYVHVVDDELALDEVVEPTGLHRFGLLRPGDVPDVLLDWLAPQGWDGPDGPEQLLTPGEEPSGPLLERLATAHVVADVAVRRAGDGGGGVLLGTFAGPGLLVLSTTRSPTGGAGTAPAVSLRPASRRSVREALAEQLETA